MSIIGQIADNINPNSPTDWGVIVVVIASVVASAGAGMKRIIDWVVTKVTAPDLRLEELQHDKDLREIEDRDRLKHLEESVETLRAEITQLHKELKESEVKRAIVEGQLLALTRQFEKNTELKITKG
jgi:predicted RNase H-like nuclease (RuvC/YqgF family)